MPRTSTAISAPAPAPALAFRLCRLIAVAAVAAVLLLAPPVLAELQIGTTIKVVNQVRAKTLNRRLKLGDNVVYQETVSTGKKSAVDIRLIDESTLIMGELSEMILDSMVYNPNKGIVEGSIEILTGIFRFTSSGVKMDVLIKTPTATIGVRGTQFDVLSQATGMEVAVHEGTIEVASAAGTENVSRGQVYGVTSDGQAGFQAEPSPAMKQAVSTMLALITAKEGDAGAPAQSQAAQEQAKAASPAPTETAALTSPASTAFKKAIAGKSPENLLYMDMSNGRMVIELDPGLAPENVKRVKELARQGFYDGLGFHFVRKGYVAETGDPTGTGTGGSGQTLPAEFSDVPFERGVVGMSRPKDDPDSADSQFFIALGRAERLDGKYTVIGKVIHGIELADGLQEGGPPENPDRIVQFRVGADVKE